jgi:predicted TIM-barrel fold metal-dependent hydrolase
LSDNNLTFDFQGFASQFDDLAMLAKEVSSLKICLVHAGMLTATDDSTVAEWRDALKVLVPCENIFIKVSGLNTFTRTLSEPLMDIGANTALDMFGAERCFFGSNFPVEAMWTTFDDYTLTQKKVLAGRTAEENRKFFHDTAIEFYGI